MRTKMETEKFCPECGSIIRKSAEVCPHCGTRQPGTQLVAAAPSGKRVGASLFAIFLGVFGAHKFYLGKPGQGLLYLVFFWTAIPAIVGLVEGILYLTMSDEEFAKKYLNPG